MQQLNEESLPTNGAHDCRIKSQALNANSRHLREARSLPFKENATTNIDFENCLIGKIEEIK